MTDPFSPPDTDPCEPLEEDAVDAWLRGDGKPAGIDSPAAMRMRGRLPRTPAGRLEEMSDLRELLRKRTWRSRIATRLEDLGGWALRVCWDAAQAVRGE